VKRCTDYETEDVINLEKGQSYCRNRHSSW